MIASEMHSLLKTKQTFVISSATHYKALPWLFSLAGTLNLVRFIPRFLLKPNIHLIAFFFGTKRKKLLKTIIEDTDLDFLRWGMYAITKWRKVEISPEIITIHGTKDLIIPKKGTKDYLVKNGGHFMIVDESLLVSTIINKEIAKIVNS
jgi:hypothetical protein